MFSEKISLCSLGKTVIQRQDESTQIIKAASGFKLGHSKNRECQKGQIYLMANAFIQRNHFHWLGAQLNLYNGNPENQINEPVISKEKTQLILCLAWRMGPEQIIGWHSSNVK